MGIAPLAMVAKHAKLNAISEPKSYVSAAGVRNQSMARARDHAHERSGCVIICTFLERRRAPSGRVSWQFAHSSNWTRGPMRSR